MAAHLDIEQPSHLLDYLRDHSLISPGETPVIRRLAGGVSNRTMLVTRSSGESWVIKQALGRLRVQTEWLSNPARVHREALGMRRLAEILPGGTVPRFVFEDERHHVLVMEAVPSPHDNWKELLLSGRLEPTHVEQFALILGTMHERGAQRATTFAREFADRAFFEELRISPYYEYTATQVPDAAEFIGDLVRTTRATATSLVHGDYSPKNVLVHNGRLALLDHEVIHWGDPAFDVGFSLAHLLSKAHHVADRHDAFRIAALRYWQVYAELAPGARRAPDHEPRAARHTLACLLARVAGRSPLEYLSPVERERQKRVVIALIAEPPATIPGLIEAFTGRIAAP